MKQSQHQIPAAVRSIVKDRCRGRCDYCGMGGSRLDMHHRKQRSVGGLDTPSNLMAVHRLCHSKIHDLNKYALGHLVPGWEDPAVEPVRLYDGWFVLGDGGEAVPWPTTL